MSKSRRVQNCDVTKHFLPNMKYEITLFIIPSHLSIGIVSGKITIPVRIGDYLIHVLFDKVLYICDCTCTFLRPNLHLLVKVRLIRF